MNFFSKIKEYRRRGRLGKAARVWLRIGLRRMRRAARSTGERRGFARRFIAALCVLALIGGIAGASERLRNSWLADEAVLARRLTDPETNPASPVSAALRCFGAYNRVQVSLRTADFDNLHPERVDLDRGSLNLVMTLRDGRMMEYTLKNRRIDNFESGSTDQFTLILPESVSVFDIVGYKLVLLPDAAGRYGTWKCRWAQVSFLLCGARTLIARDAWEGAFTFSESAKESELLAVGDENADYKQISALYPYALSVCSAGHSTVHDPQLKSAALNALGVSDGGMLYLDVETVGLETQNALLQEQIGGIDEGEEPDLLNYNGTMSLRVYFYADTGEGFTRDYPLDTLGKDDFELGGSSTFELAMPSGLSAFDIRKAELLVHDRNDAWAPRMMRLYLRTDYGVQLELARVTDTALAAERGTGIFYRGLIDTSISPVPFDLTAPSQLPAGLKDEAERVYGTEISGEAYSMYFSSFNFYERQKLFYSRLEAQFGEEQADA